MLAADAGYGSYENYLLAISRGIDPYFKYSLYDKESAPRFTPDPYKAEYLPELPDGSLQCPGGILRKTALLTQFPAGGRAEPFCICSELLLGCARGGRPCTKSAAG